MNTIGYLLLILAAMAVGVLLIAGYLDHVCDVHTGRKDPNARWRWWMLVLPLCAAMAAMGCGHSNPDPTNGHNASIHKGTDKIVVNADTAAVAVNNAKVWLNTLIQRIEAWKADPAHNPAPTTSEVEDVLNHANAELDKAGPALADTKAEAGKVADESDRQKADAEKAIAAAKNEQRQADERWGKIIVASAVAAGVWLAFERFTSYTFLVAMIPAAIAGGIAYALFGTVLALITRAVTVAWYVGIVAGVAWLAFYVYKRSRNHGLAGLLRNVELNLTPASPAQTQVAKGPSA